MNASEIDFGIEFETTLPAADETPIGGYHNGLPVAWLPEGWKAERDGSIRFDAGRKGCEFISPKLRGAAGVLQICEALDKLNDRGARVNPSCGLHITVTWNGDAAATARLVTLFANHEKALFASTGTRRRESTTYAKPIKPYGNSTDAGVKCRSDRYHGLNLTHLAAGKNRIEFRVFAGTLNKEKVVGHLLMVLGMVELALNAKRYFDWTYSKQAGQTSAWDSNGAGEGETEINRIFYRLGWTKGHTKNGYRFGDVAGLPVDWKAIKTKLRDMGKKYDTNTEVAAWAPRA